MKLGETTTDDKRDPFGRKTGTIVRQCLKCEVFFRARWIKIPRNSERKCPKCKDALKNEPARGW